MALFGVISTLLLTLVISVYFGIVAATGYPSAENMSPSSDIYYKYDKNWENDPLLPRNTVPHSYDLYLNPDLENGTFTGIIRIKIDLTEPRNYLLVHTDGLDITKTELYNENATEVEVDRAFEYKKNQFWVILLKEDLVAGKYEIKLDFSGSLTGKIVGFYRSSYTADDGSKRYIVTTKFEPTYARKAFPCFDEPRYKAVFTVHIVRPSGNNYFALSNMNQVHEEPDSPSPGLTKVSFAPTPPMSTYLACFIVCDFEHLDPVYTDQGTPITVYSRPGTKNKTEFSRNVAQKVMNYFVKYFGIEYPLPKIDLIAIPDFVSGAMENWGLITFRETRILTTPEDSVSDREASANTVAHELAHMWFGDLVTMEWWDDLWLNEGFATFLAHQVVDIVEKDLFSRMDFVIGSLFPVLDEDAREASHPIIQPVNHPDQITEIFDAISYGKGSSVLRMFESLNPKAFQTAVSKYLNKYTFKNAMTVNLWTELEEEYGIPNMTRMLNTWTKQKGFPLVIVQKDNDLVKLQQTRFCLPSPSGYNNSESPFGYKWDIPIIYRTSKKPTEIKSEIYKLDNEEFGIKLEEGTEWVILNANHYGFYRVNYTEDMWDEFYSLLANQTLEVPEDRTSLLDDAFALAYYNFIHGYHIPLKLASYLKSGTEKHYAPWIIVSKHLNKYKNMLHGTPAHEKLMKFGADLLSNAITDHVWEVSESSSNVEKLLNSTLLAFACRMEIPQVIAKANEILVNWLQGKTEKPSSSIRGLIYKYGLRGPNEADNRQRLWNLYLNESDPIEKSNFMSAIASVSKPEMITQLLELMKDENNVRSQDYFIFLHYMCQTPEGGAFIWKYMRDNWDYLVKRFTLNDRSLGRLLPNAVSYFATKEQLKEVEDFIKNNPEAGAGAAGRRKALEKITSNIKWRETNFKDFEEALNALLK